MKMFFAAVVLLAGTSAFADTNVVSCVVPSNTNAVTLSVDLADDQSVDFVTVTLKEKSGASSFFSQMDKGSVAQQIQAGYLNLLALTEQSGQDNDGVIVNTGFLGLSSEAGKFSGFLAAKGNIYPLECTTTSKLTNFYR